MAVDLEQGGMQGSGDSPVALVGTLCLRSQQGAPASWLQSSVTGFITDCCWVFIKLIQQSFGI